MTGKFMLGDVNLFSDRTTDPIATKHTQSVISFHDPLIYLPIKNPNEAAEPSMY